MSSQPHIVIIAPAYNEQLVIRKFVQSVVKVLKSRSERFTFLIVNDRSTDNTEEIVKGLRSPDKNIEILCISLAKNMGHQGAIFEGLTYATEHTECDRIIVMDADGEDDPQGINMLIDSIDTPITVIGRGERSESLLFRILYRIYKVIFRAMTGTRMNYGNFMIMSRQIAMEVCQRRFIHLASRISKYKSDVTVKILDKGKRYGGESKMSYSSLIFHAMRSFSEYPEGLVNMLLLISAVSGIVSALTIIGVFTIRFFTDFAIPGWSSMMTIGLVTITIQSTMFFILGNLLLNTRTLDAGKTVGYKIIRTRNE